MYGLKQGLHLLHLLQCAPSPRRKRGRWRGIAMRAPERQSGYRGGSPAVWNLAEAPTGGRAPNAIEGPFSSAGPTPPLRGRVIRASRRFPRGAPDSPQRDDRDAFSSTKPDEIGDQTAAGCGSKFLSLKSTFSPINTGLRWGSVIGSEYNQPSARIC